MSQQTSPNSSQLDLQHEHTINSVASPAELELACINLISQLEIQIENAKTRNYHVENAGDSGDTCNSSDGQEQQREQTAVCCQIATTIVIEAESCKLVSY